MAQVPPTHPEDEHLLAALERDPDDRALREAYVAWLERQGDGRGAWMRLHDELWREGLTPRRRREVRTRMLELARQCEPDWQKRVSRASFSEMRRRVELLLRLVHERAGTSSARDRYLLAAPLAEEELERVEAVLGFRLPEQYRQLLTRLGDGGPDLCGFISLRQAINPERQRARLAQDFPVPTSREDSPRYGIPTGALPLVETGCGGHIWLVIAGPDKGLVWEQGSGGDWLPCVVEGHWPRGGAEYDDEAAALSLPRAFKLEAVDWYLKRLNHELFELVSSVPDEYDELFALAPHDVLEVNLTGRGLTRLPEELRRFTQLRKLTLTSNNIEELPDWLGELLALEILVLKGNPLRSLPVSIGKLRKLTKLDLERCQLEALPETLGGASALVWLVLRHNRLTMLPDAIGELVDLEGLSVAHNRLATVPAGLARVAKLEVLNLERNAVADLPSELGRHGGITDVDLTANGLRTLPACVARLPRLEVLTLNENPDLDLPDACRQLAGAPNLRELSLSSMGLESLPEEIGLLRQIKILSIGQNRIARLPRAMAGLVNLVDLQCRYNGPEDPELGDLDAQAYELIPSLSGGEDE